MIVLLGLHLVVGLVLLAFARALGRWSFALAAVPPLAAVIWLAVELPGVLDGDVVTSHVDVGARRSGSTSTCASTASLR